MIILESERLCLRTVKDGDIDDLYREVFSDEYVIRYTFGQKIVNVDQAKMFIQAHCNFNQTLGLSAIVGRDSKDSVIGLGGVLECRYLMGVDYEIGFILGKNHWGKGYAQEIGQAQIDFVKNELGASRALALVSRDNEGSVKTIKKLGFNFFQTISTEDRGERDVFVLNFDRRLDM